MVNNEMEKKKKTRMNGPSWRQCWRRYVRRFHVSRRRRRWRLCRRIKTKMTVYLFIYIVPHCSYYIFIFMGTWSRMRGQTFLSLFVCHVRSNYISWRINERPLREMREINNMHLIILFLRSMCAVARGHGNATHRMRSILSHQHGMSATMKK